MLNAIFRLIAITAGTLIFAVVAVVFVRWAGLRQTFSPPAHPWYAMDTWSFQKASPELICDLAKPLNTEGITWLKIFYHQRAWTLGCDPAVSISDRIANSPQKNWLIEVDSVDTPPLDELMALLTPLDENKSFAIYSGSQRVARYLRKKSPQWLYAADAASLVRLHLFSSLWIETMLDFWPDFVLQVPEDNNTRLSTREARELERRKKRVILLPNASL